ncbi:MAG TPA: V-type ATP synthase subunit A, partial [Caldisericia bacterium]|nr:V-type ATP synthase subunit A [Caldisericia bacterium]
WVLDDALASARHFPAINWLTSYSLYTVDLDSFYKKNINEELPKLREIAMELLEKEAELEEIVRLVGIDALSPKDRMILEGAKSIREDFLHQNAYHEIDTYTSLNKQYLMLKAIIKFYEEGNKALDEGIELDKIINLDVRVDIARAKYISESDLKYFDELFEKIERDFSSLKEKNKEEVR